jgi:hypothetical protein
MLQDPNDILDSGLTRHETEIELNKAHIEYELSKRKNWPANTKYYAFLIYKFERELGMRTTPLRELKMLTLEYYRKHSELFKGITEDEMISYSVSRQEGC